MSDHTENQIDSTTTTAAQQGDDDYIESVYQTALGRSSDQEGKAHWLEELHTGLIDRNSLMEAFNNAAGHPHAATSTTNPTAPTTGSTTATTSVPQSDADYVEYAYQTVFGRSSDQAGKAYWLEELHTGLIDRNSLMEAFDNAAGHPHAATSTTNPTSPTTGSTTATPSVPQSDADYVEYAYQTVFGRSSDQAGKAYWLEELHTGLIDRNSLMEAFDNAAGHPHAATSTTNATSPTTGSTTATLSVPLSDADYVEYAYQTALGRSSDQAGKAYWLEELHTGLIDRNSLMEAFNNTPEWHTHLTLAGVATVTQGALM